ncbi:hypothetical protein ACFL1I_01595 [Candidatus Omnitrophota bacterium]
MVNLSRQKGAVLIMAYFFVVVLFGFCAVVFMRSIQENRAASVSNDAQLAFYEAEAGVSFAYYELRNIGNFNWFTHIARDIPIAIPPATNYPPGFIDVNGNYRVPARDFQVQTFPDPVVPGMVVILSQATVGAVTRTIEFRVEQESAYQYLFFYPDTQTFGDGFYNGLNSGSIHVNGDIIIDGKITFAFLKELTSGSLSADEGYIKMKMVSQFPDLHGGLGYYTTIYDPTNLPEYMYKNTTYHFRYDYTQFRTGEISDYEQATLAYYLKGADSEWEWDKYAGNGSNTTPARYKVDNRDRYNLAVYEMSGHRGGVSLCSDREKVKISIPHVGKFNDSERTVFEQIYNLNLPYADKTNAFNAFWREWEKNHKDDASYSDGKNPDRRFFAAAYNWGDLETPDGINMEWWEDMSYGDDRRHLVNDMAPAQVERYTTGKPLDLYFLNTKEQPRAWDAWLNNNNLNEAGENQTLIKDRSQGGAYVDPGCIITEDYTTHNNIRAKAKAGGIFLGRRQTEEYTAWVLGGRVGPEPSPRWEEIDPETEQFLANFVTEKQFFNALHPAGHDDKWHHYRPTRVLEIDVNNLRAALAAKGMEFNGVVYADLASYPWETQGYDQDSDGIMVTNGERLPDGGLSIVTPGNIFIKGNYNLDPIGESEINRNPDDEGVIDRVVSNKSYLDDADDLEWQPAEVLTKRKVYTLSEDFPEPSYMPMADYYVEQHVEEQYRIAQWLDPQDFVSGDRYYPSDYWVPDVSRTRAYKKIVDDWFRYYDYSGFSTQPKLTWGSWVNSFWDKNKSYTVETPDGTQHILGRDLQLAVQDVIEKHYDSKYRYAKIHGKDPQNPNNPDVPSQINSVKEKHIYNTAIVTPYATEPYVLEYWRYASRIINGANVQLPAEHKSHTPISAEYDRTYNPSETYNYEPRYGAGVGAGFLPPVGLSFAAKGSWREIN